MDALLQGYAAVAPMTRKARIFDPIVDNTAAMLMAWGIASALFAGRTGNGQKLDVPLLQAALVIQNTPSTTSTRWTAGVTNLPMGEGRVRPRKSFEEILDNRDTLAPANTPPHYGFFRTATGSSRSAPAGGPADALRNCSASKTQPRGRGLARTTLRVIGPGRCASARSPFSAELPKPGGSIQ